MNETLGGRIERLAIGRGFNQTTLAKRTGIDRSAVNRIMNDKKLPSSQEFARIASALETDAKGLAEGIETSAPWAKQLDVVLRLGQDLVAERSRVESAEARSRELDDALALCHETADIRARQIEADIATLEREILENRQEASRSQERLKRELGVAHREIRRLEMELRVEQQQLTVANHRASEAEAGALGKVLLASIGTFLLTSHQG